MTEDDISYLIELRDVYDGYSIIVYKDGRIRNRWADDEGGPAIGYERRWRLTEDAINLMVQGGEFRRVNEATT